MGTIIGEGITFDDVLLVPAYSEVIPNQGGSVYLSDKSLSDWISRWWVQEWTQLRNTEWRLRCHDRAALVLYIKNMSIQEQAEEVDKGKTFWKMVLSRIRFIYPLTIHWKKQTIWWPKFRISGVPITENGKLVGIITNRDLKFGRGFQQKIKESMTSENLITAKEGITLEEAKDPCKSKKEKLPIVDDNFNLKGLITIKDIENRSSIALFQRDSRAVCCAVLSASNGKRSGSCEELVNAHVDVVVLDSAHGHSANVLNCVRMIKENYPDLQVIAGNVATARLQRHWLQPEQMQLKLVSDLVLSVQHVWFAGIGVPQITAVMDCYSVAKRVWYPDYRRWRVLNTRRYDKSDRSRCECLYMMEACLLDDESREHWTVPGKKI